MTPHIELPETLNTTPLSPNSARELARDAVNSDVRWLESGMRLTSRAYWFQAGDQVIAVTGHRPMKQAEADADRALAYGLHHANGRKLVLILPTGSERAVVTRAPWIRPIPEIWTFNLDGLAQGGKTSPAEVKTASADRVFTKYLEDWEYTAEAESPPPDYWRTYLGEKAAWLEPLLEWATNNPDLAPAHRPGYLAWHCRGTMVLNVRRGKYGLKVTSGIHRSKRGPIEVGGTRWQPELLEGPIGRAAINRLIGHASLGAAGLLEGDDEGRREHRLQASIAAHKSLRSLGLTDSVRREYPAWRPYAMRRGRAFIDFLGAGDDGKLHVIETKIGDDPMLVLQGLDYWIWCMANRPVLTQRFGLPPSPSVAIDFVGGRPSSKKPAFGIYTHAQSGALAPEVEHRFHEIKGWEGDESPLITPLDLDFPGAS